MPAVRSSLLFVAVRLSGVCPFLPGLPRAPKARSHKSLTPSAARSWKSPTKSSLARRFVSTSICFSACAHNSKKNSEKLQKSSVMVCE